MADVDKQIDKMMAEIKELAVQIRNISMKEQETKFTKENLVLIQH